MTCGKTLIASVTSRARTVLLAIDCLPDVQIGEITSFSDPTVRRYELLGAEGLDDVQRPGMSPEVDELALATVTLPAMGSRRRSGENPTSRPGSGAVGRSSPIVSRRQVLLNASLPSFGPEPVCTAQEKTTDEL
ncbi:hypothetical protein [Arthrobacter sp. MYb224]|uniref:hypothetical protein n=1 Tax=Arthrobacter sp. MYb224 TaxID=1848600 RepID=UPI0011B086A5|nr:hypothetical protein [Arthrobacter sp. MYb224]